MGCDQMAIHDSGIFADNSNNNLNSNKDSRDANKNEVATVSSVVVNNVDVDGKNTTKIQPGHYEDDFFNLHIEPSLLLHLSSSIESTKEDEGWIANNNKIDNFKEKNYLNNNQSFKRFIHHIGASKSIIIFIANALLIHCITSVEPFDNLYHYTNYPRFHQLMQQHLQRQSRYNQYNGNTNSNWTADEEGSSRRRANNNNNGRASQKIFSQFVADGEKVTRLKQHIDNVLVPRVSGTQGNINVRNYIVQQLDSLGYSVHVDKFKDRTPQGEIEFGNIIAESDPKACKQLVLACHYDSKKLPGFLGATDSAVPCAILLEIARTIKDHNLVNTSKLRHLHGVRFVFFDGEEAFVEWTDTDSLYGSRHLADKWSKQAMPKECGNGSELKRISLFVLLDLIGAKDTRIPRYFDDRLYHKMATLEKQYLTEFKEPIKNSNLVFTGRYDPWNTNVQDDHVPFLRRQVPILLLLAGPFPTVWHTVNDNSDCIDYPKTIRTMAVVDQFTIDYLNDIK